MKRLFVLQHAYQHGLEDREEEVKFIGVYSSREKAEDAVRRLILQPGFREHPSRNSVPPEWSGTRKRFKAGSGRFASEAPFVSVAGG